MAPCSVCGDNFVQQVDGVCFDCITRPLLGPNERDAHDRQVAEPPDEAHGALIGAGIITGSVSV